ncbi:MAG TPA: lamin tail domain-containing protein, partial [Pyrinomonadaceae bacterium]|nr:lamin tail domain-containing protein [Pyrinomonadaceae bacterium]
MQNKPVEFRLETFNPTGAPVAQVEPMITMTPFDPNDPSSLGTRDAGQPGDTPEAASNMRITQVYTHGGEAGATFLNDYIEIFNAGNTTININGWAVVVNTLEGSTQQAFAAKYTSDNQITPGMHLLIRYAGNGSNGQPLTGLLSTINDISLGSTSGQVFLLSPAQVTNFTPTCPTSLGPTGTVTDFFGYGPTSCSETSPAPALTQANKSLTRINGGCTDTDNNLSDFSIVDPNPRNIFSAATPCGSQPTPTPTPTPGASPTPTPTPSANGTMRISQIYT